MRGTGDKEEAVSRSESCFYGGAFPRYVPQREQVSGDFLPKLYVIEKWSKDLFSM